MMKLNRRLTLSIAFVLSLLAGQAAATDWAITSNSIENLSGSLSSVSPAVNTPSNAANYLDSSSALGYYGPIGPYGPLGTLGPVGSNSWDVSYWISGVGSWAYWSDTLTALGGPLSESGPLGPNGPLSDTAYDEDLPAINDFAKQLQAGGVWTVLGPVGPLGALGPLGPLGPVGAHGYGTDSYGQYKDGSIIKREVNVAYNGGSRTYELYENYTEPFAKTMANNDTSFMLEGYIAYPYSETDTFEFISGDDQYVTVLLVPMYTLDDFDLVIKDENGNVLATANTYNYVDFVQLNNVASGTTLTVEVTLYSTGHSYIKDYRLFVVGSTSYIGTDTPITGNHQLSLN